MSLKKDGRCTNKQYYGGQLVYGGSHCWYSKSKNSLIKLLCWIANGYSTLEWSVLSTK